MYSWITSSVTLPLDATKQPRAHKSRPQYAFSKTKNLKVSPEGEGFRPIARTYKTIPSHYNWFPWSSELPSNVHYRGCPQKMKTVVELVTENGFHLRMQILLHGDHDVWPDDIFAELLADYGAQSWLRQFCHDSRVASLLKSERSHQTSSQAAHRSSGAGMQTTSSSALMDLRRLLGSSRLMRRYLIALVQRPI
jgi:hypothetical protein